MRISKPRREIYKQTIRSFMAVNPGINNLELATKIGIHRNTITKLLEEIRTENDIWVKERWKMLLNEVTDFAGIRNRELNELWAKHSRSYSTKPSEMVAITRTNWMILKDLYRFHLEYMGIRDMPKTMIQVNVKTDDNLS